MSDLDSMLGGMGGISPAEAAPSGQDKGAQDPKAKSKKVKPPKPDWVVKREKATGITAEWNDSANAGRGAYEFPGLSPKMGGPAAGSAQPAGQDQAAPADKAAPAKEDVKLAPIEGMADKEVSTFTDARKAFLAGDSLGAWKTLEAMIKANPSLKMNKTLRSFRMKVAVDANINTSDI